MATMNHNMACCWSNRTSSKSNGATRKAAAIFFNRKTELLDEEAELCYKASRLGGSGAVRDRLFLMAVADTTVLGLYGPHSVRASGN